jgi:hypothetical protein
MAAVEKDLSVDLVHKARPRERKAGSTVLTACGSTARCARARCGTRSCALPTTMPSRESCSSTA